MSALDSAQRTATRVGHLHTPRRRGRKQSQLRRKGALCLPSGSSTRRVSAEHRAASANGGGAADLAHVVPDRKVLERLAVVRCHDDVLQVAFAQNACVVAAPTAMSASRSGARQKGHHWEHEHRHPPEMAPLSA
eukprot:3585408-Rhodomonas_salina.2